MKIKNYESRELVAIHLISKNSNDTICNLKLTYFCKQFQFLRFFTEEDYKTFSIKNIKRSICPKCLRTYEHEDN